MKKQNMIEQSQRDYINFMSNKQKIELQQQGSVGSSFRKKNSKLMEINTFKIGGDNREIKRKNYQEYNENLNLNPTKNYMPPLYSMNKPASAQSLGGDLSNYNSIVGNITQNQPTKEIQTQVKPHYNDQGMQQNPYYSEYKQQGAHGYQCDINPNILNQGGINDNYQHRPISGSKQVNQYQPPYDQTHSIQDQEQYQNYREANPSYDKYPPIDNYLNNSNSQQSDYGNYNYKSDGNPYESYKIEPIKQTNQIPIQPPNKQKKVADLNSISVPEYIKTVEDYERYLVSLGIDPLTLEYTEEPIPSKQEELELQLNRLSLGNNNAYSIDQNIQNVNYQYQQQKEHKNVNQQPSKSISPYLPNYGIKPSYKNQSSLVLGDASTYQKNKVAEIKKDYEPLIKVKPLVINPCKF